MNDESKTINENGERSEGNVIDRIFGATDHGLFWPVFIILAVALTIVFISPEASQKFLNTIKNGLLKYFSWGFLLGVAATTAFALYVGFSKYGMLKLGKDDEKPEFSFMAWVSMLFSCGIGIGFIFWGVAEPLYHMYQAPHVTDPGIAGTAAYQWPFSLRYSIGEFTVGRYLLSAD